MANPNRLTKGEAAVGYLVTKDGIEFSDRTIYSTALVHYLSCYSLTDQAGSTTTPTPFIFEVTDIAKGFSVVTDGTNLTKLKAAHAGVYNFIWSGQFENINIQSKDIYVWFRINGQDVAGSTGLVAVPLAHAGSIGHGLIGWNFFLSLNAGDEVQLMWMKETADVTLQHYAASANYPSTASVVLTIDQIA